MPTSMIRKGDAKRKRAAFDDEEMARCPWRRIEANDDSLESEEADNHEYANALDGSDESAIANDDDHNIKANEDSLESEEADRHEYANALDGSDESTTASDDDHNIKAKGESDDMPEDKFRAICAIEYAWREVDSLLRELEARTALELAALQFLAVVANVEHAAKPSS